MARQLRLRYAGAIYHVTVRSNGGVALFENDFDRRYLLGRMGEAAETYQVRIYLFCLMDTHFHVVLETPRANVQRFMQGVLTGYGVHFNRVHQRHGHVTQGRYGAKLVEGDEYLLQLSRYVHLNPVKVAAVASLPLKERRTRLRAYAWSSFQGYAGLGARNDFVDYEAVLALMGGRRAERVGRYREYVEAGLATDDEEFVALLARSARSIGSERFRERVEAEYRALVSERLVVEDVVLRRQGQVLPVEGILEVVAKEAGMAPEALRCRRRDARWRAVASRFLCQYGGLTQRGVAEVLGVKTGVAVSCQIKQLTRRMETDEALRRAVQRVGTELDERLRQLTR